MGLYLLIPALAGFLAARQNGDTASGVGPGCLVGGISWLVIVVATTLIIVLTPPQPVCQPGVCGRAFVSAAALGEAIIVTTLFFEILGSLFGGLVGGLIGGALGRRWATASNQRSGTSDGEDD